MISLDSMVDVEADMRRRQAANVESDDRHPIGMEQSVNFCRPEGAVQLEALLLTQPLNLLRRLEIIPLSNKAQEGE